MEFDIISLGETAMFKSDYSAEFDPDDGTKVSIFVECGEVAEFEQSEGGDYELWTDHIKLIILEEVFPFLLRPITQYGDKGYYTLRNFSSEITERRTFMLRDFEKDIVIRAAVLKEGGDYVLSPVVATSKSKAIAFKELKYHLCNYGDKWAAIRPNEDL